MIESLTLAHYEKMESYIPVDLLSLKGFSMAFGVVLFFIMFRYFLMVGGAYKLFWQKNFGKILHDGNLAKNQIRDEIKWSLLSSVLFALSGVLMGIFWQIGASRIYLKFDEYSLWYLPISFIIYTLFHEVYFYFTHVWMHRPSIYKKVHRIHHLSVKTSPFASFSFHPYEALVHAAFIPFMITLVPIHPVVIIAYLTFMTVTAISNHMGIELIPFKVIRDHFISGEHHSIHHQKMRFNYGLYYTFMDKLMHTEDSSLNKETFVTNLEKSYE
jgi:sterol desaturase/sphingolipid hydroxylase (fatty acid hydroxylase superfamily)